MSSSVGSGSARPALRIVRVLGYFVFLSAFFLPAVSTVATPGSRDADVYKGSFCAWITIINTFNHEFWQSRMFLAILSGWINPLMLLFVSFQFSARLRVPRRIVAVLILLFVAGTWVYFYVAPMVPLIGHFFWVAGILMILCGEFAEWARNDKPKS